MSEKCIEVQHVSKSFKDEKVLLQKKRAQLLAKIVELTRQNAILDTYLADKENTLSAPVLVNTLLAVTVAYKQKRIRKRQVTLI